MVPTPTPHEFEGAITGTLFGLPAVFFLLVALVMALFSRGAQRKSDRELNNAGRLADLGQPALAHDEANRSFRHWWYSFFWTALFFLALGAFVMAYGNGGQ